MTRRTFALLSAGPLFRIHAAPVLAKSTAGLPLLWRESAVLDRISPDSLKGHVGFLASDALAGRATPSPELDIAAEYIASQFRGLGLRPAGDQEYFQEHQWLRLPPTKQETEAVISQGGEPLTIPPAQLRVLYPGEFKASAAPVLAVPLKKASDAAALQAEDVRGRVLILAATEPRTLRVLMYEGLESLLDKEPRLVLLSSPSALRSPEGAVLRPGNGPVVPVLAVESSKLTEWVTGRATDLRLTLETAPPRTESVTLRNVIGVVPGWDPRLKDTYVLISAHYDHLGRQEKSGSKTVYNGANDDASGTAGVLELAKALRAGRPRRSIAFVAYYGEEEGLLGSRAYVQHPAFPLAKTVADLNLEQLGRTDDSEGKQVGTVAVTGFDFSDLGTTLRAAGQRVGVRFYGHPKYSEEFFSRSDNQALADVGVPASTLSVAYAFPDYHEPGDDWQKLDYANFTRILKAIALGVLTLANREQPPSWNQQNQKAARYLAASRVLQGNRFKE